MTSRCSRSGARSRPSGWRRLALPLALGFAAVGAANAAPGTEPEAWQLQMHGELLAREQAAHPGDASVPVPARQTLWLARDGHFRLETESRFPGDIVFRYRETGNAQGAQRIDLMGWRDGTAIQAVDAQTARQHLADQLLWFPEELLRQSTPLTAVQEQQGHWQQTLRDPAGRELQLRWSGAQGRLLEVRQGALRYVYLGAHDERGLQAAEIEVYTGERRIQRWQLQRADAVEPSSTRPPMPAGYEPQTPTGELRAEGLAPGVYRVEGVASRYHNHFIVGPQGVVVFDTPVSREEGARVRALIERTAPGLPIAAVVLSHGHRDHCAGLPAYLEAGTRLFVGRGGRQALARQHGAAQAERAEEVRLALAIELGGRPLRLLPVTSSHAEDMLVAWDATSRSVFHGDLFYAPEQGPVPPAFEGTEELSQALHQAGLEPQRVLGVHGRAASADDVRQSLGLRRRAL
ncbi:MBL fold metallo-hydrolase [Mitsuaria sp. WAJ17]|uniref:MBL fold metallo-hydrolase n=1 Tax=Mitsuaria sp. WAJ17 TaxID=2761452 RepID=UPI0015FFFFF5|nr:MBL fold metallo-hydrolase [Mitsuaria sp. WAJ17]MBB2486167.1 MBL fold metallo-hydrolase [Mitsuaria sp. WAJ17]